MLQRFLDWLHEEITWPDVGLGVALFVGTLLGSLLIVGFLLVRLPATYFQENHPRSFWADRHPALRVFGIIVKNLLGVFLIVLGVALSLPGVPGQGILTILIGLMLLDLPGKRGLERKLVGRPRVLRTVNRLRRRYGRPPLILGGRGARLVKNGLQRPADLREPEPGVNKEAAHDDRISGRDEDKRQP